MGSEVACSWRQGPGSAASRPRRRLRWIAARRRVRARYHCRWPPPREGSLAGPGGTTTTRGHSRSLARDDGGHILVSASKRSNLCEPLLPPNSDRRSRRRIVSVLAVAAALDHRWGSRGAGGARQSQSTPLQTSSHSRSRKGTSQPQKLLSLSRVEGRDAPRKGLWRG